MALTNIRLASCVSKVSRGLLVKRLLEQSSFDPQKWLVLIRDCGCAGFNILFADTREARAFVYCSATDEMQKISITQTAFTLANGCPNSNWPREERILKHLNQDYLQILR